MKPVNVGVIGCGKISSAYIQNMKQFPMLNVVGCADLNRQRAQERAEECGLPGAYEVPELIAHQDVELIVNLTIPKAHLEVTMAALDAGKHVYSEKPMALSCVDARAILDNAAKRNLLFGGAPDTVLGSGIQTSRKLVEDGAIGRPLSAVAFMMARGPETWHPDPEFLYKPGGGPMYDMGPYYVAALVHLLGPIRKVTGAASTPFATRMITSEQKYGQMIEVEIPTHISGTLEFENGALATLITSFDIAAGSSKLPSIELYGSEGTLNVPKPFEFSGQVLLRKSSKGDWAEMPLLGEYKDHLRGLGVADMACAIRSGREFRANGEMAYHVMEAMEGIHWAADHEQHYRMQSRCPRPALMNLDMHKYYLEL
ncbi:MAG: gfo/Idh/MocA family oxidoreductase [Paenibacillaceae bacterium]|jgi:predicted dehydrogenase|nr:gfo/Idh/MocA family oxidoreductase [Paenibacillaceae bacterium]